MHIKRTDTDAFCGEPISPGDAVVEVGEVDQVMASLAAAEVCSVCRTELGKAGRAEMATIRRDRLE